MHPYIQAVLQELYLPTLVKRDVEAELEKRLAPLPDSATLADCAEALGQPAQVAADYNARYRSALATRNIRMNCVLLALFLFLALFTFLVARQFYNYAKERVMYMQYSMFYSQINPDDASLPSVGPGDADTGPPAPGSNSQRPFNNLKKPEPNFQVRIDIPTLVAQIAGAVLSVVGIHLCFHQKKKWRQYSSYIPITEEPLSAETDL